MKYYVVSDVHGFYSEMIKALKEAGFFEETEPCKVVVVGDLLDRGSEARKLIEFMLKLHYEDMLIYIMGNHETLLVDCLLDVARSGWVPDHHLHNRTWDTLLQISGMTDEEGERDRREVVRRVIESSYYQILLPAAIDYYETERYIFTHGWLPCVNVKGSGAYVTGEYDPDWRAAEPERWKAARWFNGMRMACLCKAIDPGKTVVCGHWHASYGHKIVDHIGTEFGEDADFTPFYGEGIVAIDACTAESGFVNCVVIVD